MDITVSSLIEGARSASGITVIIDVFRCFTTEAVAFEKGAKKIILVAEIEEAFDLKADGVGDILMGEVGGKKPEGFDYGNSPFELLGADLKGKTIIQSTRAGTVGVTNASGADLIYGGSLAVASATVRALKAHNPSKVTLVAMGSEGIIRADEDEQCALYLRNLLQGRVPDIEAVKSLIMAGEESQKYDDREMALNIDSHDFALRISIEDGFFISQPELLE